MTALHIIFYLFSITAIVSGFMVVTAKNAVRSALFLVLTFFAMAGVWMLLRAEFLALILILVYVGAVMTLFLFVVMMLNLDTSSLREGFVRYLPFGVAIVLLLMGLVIVTIAPARFVAAPALEAVNDNNIANLGMVLYTDYAYPFEVAGALLLTAIVAAISLTHRVAKRRKVQNISEQIAVQPEQRIRLVNMPAEKKYKPEGGAQ